LAVKEDITARRHAEEAQRYLATIVEVSHDAIFGSSLDGTITSWNRGAEQLYGYTAAEAIGQRITFLVPPDRMSELIGLVTQVRLGEHIAEFETERLRKDGGRVWVSITIAPMHAEQGDQIGAAIVARDISARKAAEMALRASEAQFRSLVEQAPVGACIIDDQGRFEAVNEACAVLFGYRREELVGQPLGLLFPIDEQDNVRTWYADRVRTGVQVQQEYEMVTKGGERLTVLGSSIQIAPDSAGRARRSTFLTDITAQKQTERLLAHAAHHDALTGLPNRMLFDDRLDHALRTAQRDTAPLAVLMIDLDEFKAVNDTLGHAVGDELLQVMATRLQAAVRDCDTVARLGGDEFAILLPRAEGEGARRVASLIVGGLAEPMWLRDRAVSVGASIGIALYPAHGEDAKSLMRCADQAMYSAKAAGAEYLLYRDVSRA
jgi:diguanylate cyclase (GGDEF)-like protein/PAS domain S-box-containing protein